MRVAILVLSAMVLFPALAGAQVDPKRPTGPGPSPMTPSVRSPAPMKSISGEVYIGEPAPDFELPGSESRSVKLSTLRGDWVLLVFAPRKEGLQPLASIVEEGRKIGLRVVGVCDEKAYHLVAFAQRGNVPVLMLSDDTHEVSAIYGMYDSERRTTRDGIFLLDRQGIVRFAFFGRRLPAQDALHLARYNIEAE